MKDFSRLWNSIVDSMLICCGVLGAVFAVPSAYDVDFKIATIVCVSALFSFALSYLLHSKKKPFLPILLFLIAVGFYAGLDGQSFITGLRILYSTTVRLPALIFSFLPSPSDTAVSSLVPSPWHVTSALIVMAAVFSVLISLSVIKSRSPLPAILCVLPSIILSMVYTDCTPALYAVTLLVIYIGGILLETGIRGISTKHAIVKFVFLSLLFLLAIVLRALSPEKQYVPIPYEQRQYILGERFGIIQDSFLSLFSKNPKQYDLESISDRVLSDDKAFSIRSSTEGCFLMRSHSYGLYSQNSFTTSPQYNGSWNSMHALCKTQEGDWQTISVNGALTNERIVPYAFLADDFVKVEEGFIRSYGETSYLWYFKPHIRFLPVNTGKDEDDYYSFALDNYTLPDGEQKAKLIELMDENSPSAVSIASPFSEFIRTMMRNDHYSAALKVADMVRGIGTYTLTPGETPGNRDLVEYFICENKKGYCVHYASATAAFLQALDIPARFVIGYRVEIAKADSWHDVTNESSHAWVEVYIKGVGWVPIECTPGFPDSGAYVPEGENTPIPSAEATTPPTPEAKPTPDSEAQATEVPITEVPITEVPTARSSMHPHESAVPTTSPKPKPGGDEGSEGNGAENGTKLIWLAIIPAIIALWLLIGLIVEKIRRHQFEQSDANAAVLYMLRYLRRLERFGVPSETDMKTLGEEAVFSNHSMEASQAELLERCALISKTALKHKPLMRFLLKRLIFLL